MRTIGTDIMLKRLVSRHALNENEGNEVIKSVGNLLPKNGLFFQRIDLHNHIYIEKVK